MFISNSRDESNPPRMFHDILDDEACCIRIIDQLTNVNIAICKGNKRLCEDHINSYYKLKHKLELGDASRGIGYTLTNENEFFIAIWLRSQRGNFEFESLSTLTHESIHAVYGLMSIMGMPICDQNEEFVAYMSGYICNCYLSAYGGLVEEENKETKES